MSTTVEQPLSGKDGQNDFPANGAQPPMPECLTTILQCLNTMKDGDFSVRLPVSWTGLPGKIADNFNDIVTANEQMAFELKRVGQAVGKEGKTRERIRVEHGRGAWDDMEVSINTLVEDLLRPTTEVTRAIAAVAQGNLTQTVRLDVDGRPLEGEFLRSANIVNTMIQQLGVFTAEVTRVAREVGTDGKLGGQAVVPGVAGTWKDLTDSVNSMASNLTGQVRNIAEVDTAVASGDLSRKITVDVRGEILQLKEAINTMVDQLRSFASEVTRVAREVGTDGKLGGQAVVPGVAGTWKDLTDSVNAMAGNLTAQVRNIAEVTTAVARGDLSRKITVDVKGEILELKDTINTMVDQLNAFAGEVTRVAREVGTEGKLGGQASVPGVAGTWKDLTDNVNFMAGNLTGQVRNIAEVATAIANGDLSRKITVDVRGEILQLKETLNTMVGYRSGAVDYISVPVIPEVLRAKIGVFVELHRKTRMLEMLNNELEQRVVARTEELRLSEEQFRTRAELLDLASEAIMVRDLTGEIRFWNAGAERLYGWRRDEVLGKDIHTLLRTVFPVSREATEAALRDRKMWQGNLLQKTRDDSEILVACRKTMNHEGDAVLEVNRDITAESRAEEALREAEKLAAMGRVAGIIAHEINNPLAAITNLFFLLRNHPSLDEEARHCAILAEQELQRVSHITRQTLSFYRESKTPIPVLISELLDDVIGLQERGLQVSRIALEKTYSSPGAIQGFPVELRQIFLNLIGNAIQAMPDGGTLRLAVREGIDWVTPRRGLWISITDTGVGINSQDAKKLFEPFFSTKSTKGTGLGLWISKGIAQKYNGRIAFRSLRRGNGCVTCFRVFLPTAGGFNITASNAVALSHEASPNGYNPAMQHA